MERDQDISLLDVANSFLRRRRLLFLIPLTFSLVAAIISLLLPLKYTAHAAFVPEVSSSGRMLSSLSGLASQFGLSIGGEATQVPQFYVSVLKSRSLTDRLLLTRFSDHRTPRLPTDSASLLDLLDLDGDSLEERLHHGRKLLDNLIAAKADLQSGLVRLSVEGPDPDLAASVANQLLSYLNEFNLQSRQSQARERRRFVEERIESARTDLRSAEDELRTFHQRNRSFQQSPQLAVEEGRLNRLVQLRQEVFTTLSREYETARIEEVNNTPVITVIDRAVSPQERSSPRRTLMVLMAGVVGTLFAASAVAVLAHLERVRAADPEQWTSMQRLLAEISDELHRIRLRPSAWRKASETRSD